MEALQGNLHKFIYTLQDAGGGFQVSLKDGTKTQRRTAGRFLKKLKQFAAWGWWGRRLDRFPLWELVCTTAWFTGFFFSLLWIRKPPCGLSIRKTANRPNRGGFNLFQTGYVSLRCIRWSVILNTGRFIFNTTCRLIISLNWGLIL